MHKLTVLPGTFTPTARVRQPRWPTLCPACGADTIRVQRLWADRLLSLLLPVRRHRCVLTRCGWQGRVRTDS